MFGDCLERMKEIPDNSIDCVLTDPPYGTTACKWDTIIPFEPMWEQLKRITKDNGAICLFGQNPFTSNLIMSNPKMYRYDWVWDKGRGYGHLVAKKQPMVQHELISVFSSKQANYYPQGLIAGKFNNNRPAKAKGKTSDLFNKERSIGVSSYTNYPKTIKLFPKDGYGRNNFHPTQKPVKLLEYLINTYTKEGETVLDFTMGSGSTGVACKNLKRNFIGIECVKEYFRIAKQRIKDA